jgi:predicted ATP-dependent endonuclease of OLD family
MAKIYSLKINNYRGIKAFEQVFGFTDFICLIGRGGSGKTTIIEAISKVLSPNWNLPFIDTDFYNSNIDEAINIEVTLYDLPSKITQEDKFGLYLRGLNKETLEINKELSDDDEPILAIRLVVGKDLEPIWTVIDEHQQAKDIRALDRAIFNVFLVSDYIDKHFSWNYGSPLYSLLKQEKDIEGKEENIVIDSLRDAKKRIDENSFSYLDSTFSKLATKAAELGIDIDSGSKTTIDVRDLFIKDGKVCLHQDDIPFRLKGKGDKRLISIAIQTALVEDGGIVLIDEIEQGLEPDRVQHLANRLKKNNSGQIFITTHSRDVLVELIVGDLFLMKEGAVNLISFEEEMQGVLRNSPEAFFAKRILLCEGATEVGFCRSINNFRINNGEENLALKGIRIVDGRGDEQVKYAQNFIKSGFDVCLFCDSDVDKVNKDKEDLIRLGVSVVDCDDGKSIEQQIFYDIPWTSEGVYALINYHKKVNGVTQEVFDSNLKLRLNSMSLGTDSETTGNTRKALGFSSSKKGWFKRIDHGMRLGEICCDNLDEMKTKRLGKQIDKISKWIDND